MATDRTNSSAPRPSCWFVRSDPCGVFLAIFIHVLSLAVALAVNNYSLLPQLQGIVAGAKVILYNLVVLCMLACHAAVVFTNPGTARHYLDQELQKAKRAEFTRLRAAGHSSQVASRLRPDDTAGKATQRKWWCVACDTYRPKYTHHCKTCGACVLEMDHHCPCVNNCVGWRNHKYFLLFVGYAWIACAWSMLALGISLFTSVGTRVPEFEWHPPVHEKSHALHSNELAQLGCAAGCVVSFMLGVFVSVMCCDQWEFLAGGLGAVDQKLAGAAPMPYSKRTGRPVMERLSEILGAGRPLGPRWFLPIPSGSMEIAFVFKDG